MMSASLTETLAARLEWFLSHGVERASAEDALVIRRSRGFGLIGVVVIVLIALVSMFTFDPLEVLIPTFGMLACIIGGTAVCFYREDWVRPVTHAAIGASLIGILATSVHTGHGNDTSATFPILLILIVSYVLGAKAAAFWTLASIAGIGFQIYASDLRALGIDNALATKPGLFATRSIVFVGVLALATVERRFADGKAAQLEFLARHDELTGLFTRRAFTERAAEALTRASRHERNVAMLVIDLDGFKAINDEHGHAAGDEALRAIGRVIASRTRSTDSAGRMGGDEFLVLLEDVTEEKDVMYFAERLVDAISQPVEAGGAQVSVGASIGVAISPEAGETAEALTRAADMAMFKAKNDGGRQVHLHGMQIDEAPEASLGVACTA